MMRATRATLFSLVLIAGLWIATSLFLFATRPHRTPKNERAVIEIHRGMAPREIARRLTDLGAISDPESFFWLGKLTFRWSALKAGEYQVSPKMSPLEIFAVLTSGVSILHPVTIHEGDNIYQVAAEFQRKNLDPQNKILSLIRDSQFIASLGIPEPVPPSLEGYCFPDTYYFTKLTSPEQMLTKLVRRFFMVWTPELEAAAKKNQMTRHEVITLASVIEKETGARTERHLISSVFHNRLKKGMRLQSDPTTIYGIWESYTGNIKREHLRQKTPYNTYTIPGLPIGPISNPGKDALWAAVHPHQSNYLFFVSRNNGTHYFSATYAEHARAVTEFQRDAKARAGKSWRDLNAPPAGPVDGPTISPAETPSPGY